MHKTKEDRQREAQDRQAKRGQRSNKEQLRLLAGRSGFSEKETMRIARK